MLIGIDGNEANVKNRVGSNVYALELIRLFAKEKKHSTSVDAANMALRMNAKQLILTHISSRYQEDAEKLLKEAQEIFPNTILAQDLLRIDLN